MHNYVLNSNRQDSESGKNHEVHRDDCNYLPNLENQIQLGECLNCHDAVKRAKEFRPEWQYDIDGCIHCCPLCHNE